MAYAQKLEILRADLLRLLNLSSSSLTLPDLWQRYMDLLGIPPGNLEDRQAYAAAQNGISLIAYQNGDLFRPQSLFTANQVGGWYDPSDMSTLFQDHICTTPVTALEQTVAFMLDKSRGLVRGAELVSNGDFSAGLTGWSAIGTGGSSAVISGELEITGDGGNTPGRRQVITTVVGTLYEITITGRQGTTVQNVNAAFGASSLTFTTSQTKTMKVIATATTTNLDLIINNAAASGTAYFDNISVKAIPGLHVGQTTAAQRPVISARVNRLSSTANIQGAGWTVANSATTTSARQLNIAAVADSRLVFTTSTSPVGTSYVAMAKLSGTGTINLELVDSGGAFPRTSTLVNLTDQPTLYQVARTQTDAASTGVQFRITGVGTSATVFIDEPQQEIGVVLSRYQRVNTATDYDTSGFPTYLKFDGTDDGIFTPYVPTGQNFPFTLACAAKDGIDVLGGIFGIWGGAPPYYEIQKSGTVNQWRAFDRGAINYSNVEIGTSSRIHVLTGEYTSTTVNLRIDATDPTAATTQDNVFGTITDIRIGNGGGGFFNGNFYGGVVRFGTMSFAERTNLERYLASKSGIII